MSLPSSDFVFPENLKRIALLIGGPGSERPVSQAAAPAVAAALRSLGVEVIEVDVTGPGFEIPENTDLAFNIIHGTFGEDGTVQRELDERGVRYTGEGVAGSVLAFDKILSKQCFVEKGIPSARFEIVPAGATPSLPLPYVIKAPCEGSSVGIYIVRTPEEIAPAVADAAKYGEQLLVEEYVAGRELTVGILGDLALPVVEICPKEGFYDFANKYPFLDPKGKGSAEHYCPARIDEATTLRLQECALAAHRALGLEIYSRVDFLLREDGTFVVLEINTIPGMTRTSLLPEAAAHVGIAFPQLCGKIAALSLARYSS